MKTPKIGFTPVPIANQSRKFAIWDGQPMRCPKQGELFLSGAKVEAYLASQDLTTEYFIAVPLRSQGVGRG